jgi:hypothetical protein
VNRRKKIALLLTLAGLSIAAGIAGARFYLERLQLRSDLAVLDTVVAEMNAHPERLTLLEDGSVRAIGPSGKEWTISPDELSALRSRGLMDVHDLKVCQEQFDFSGPLIAKCAEILSDPIAREAVKTAAENAIDRAYTNRAEEWCHDSGPVKSDAYAKCLRDSFLREGFRISHDEILRRMDAARLPP